MLKTIKFLFIVSIIDCISFLVWSILIINPLSPFQLLLSIPLFLILPKNIFSSNIILGYILPLLVVPILLMINFIISRKFFLEENQIQQQSFFTNIILLVIPVLISFMVIFGPTVITAKLLEGSVVRNTTVIGEPRFVLQDTAQPGYLNFIINIPVNINTNFNGVWIGDYFNIRFSPSNEQILSIITACKLDAVSLYGIQPPSSGGKNSPGEYTFSFQFSFHGEGCSQDSFNALIGKRLELLQITNNKTTAIKSFTVNSFKTEIYK